MVLLLTLRLYLIYDSKLTDFVYLSFWLSVFKTKNWIVTWSKVSSWCTQRSGHQKTFLKIRKIIIFISYWDKLKPGQIEWQLFTSNDYFCYKYVWLLNKKYKNLRSIFSRTIKLIDQNKTTKLLSNLWRNVRTRGTFVRWTSGWSALRRGRTSNLRASLSPPTRGSRRSTTCPTRRRSRTGWCRLANERNSFRHL